MRAKKLNATLLQIIVLLWWICPHNTYAQQDLDNLIFRLNTAQGKEEKVDLLRTIAVYYQKQEAYTKAIDYYSQALAIQSESDSSEKSIRTQKSMVYCYAQLKEYDKAIALDESILDYYKGKNDLDGQLLALDELAQFHKSSENYPKAIEYTNDMLNIYQVKNNQEGILNVYNNLGYLYGLEGDKKRSIENYQRAIYMGSLYNLSQKKPTGKAALLTNAGVAYSQMKDFTTSNDYFNQALEIYEKEGDLSKQAHGHNYIAANFLISGRNDQAIQEAVKGLEIAGSIEDENALLESYQILAEAYQRKNDFKESQKNLRLLQSLKDKMNERKRFEEQKTMENQILIERKESELKQLMADKEKQTLALKQSELEREKQEQDLKIKENELALLKRNQELQASALKNQQLENERVEQLLEITKQKSIADNERLLAENQKAETERQKLLAEKANIEKEKEQKAREASEQEQLAQQQQLESEKNLRWYSYLVLALIGIVTILVIIGLISARRAAADLRKKNNLIQIQKEEIETQNEELFQNQEEIVSQRDAIEQKSKELEDYNKQVKNSINAALLIQNAILPYEAKLNKLLGEYFVVYRPKDVVSGDFFWLNEIDGFKILFVADCTGHGVPGAFMTLIGNTLLDKIIRVWRTRDPAEVLSKLHDEIKMMLNQEESGNNNGMDANMIVWRYLDNGNAEITWAGAKHNLMCLPSKSSEFQHLKGTRKAIGGCQNEQISFQNQVAEFPKNTLIFMSTDGLTDQNNIERKRLGENKLMEIILSNKEKSLSEIKKKLDDFLDDYMKGTNQRDDMLLIGFKL